MQRAVELALFDQFPPHFDDQRDVLVADRALVHAGVAGGAAPDGRGLDRAADELLPVAIGRPALDRGQALGQNELLEIVDDLPGRQFGPAGGHGADPLASPALGAGVAVQEHPPGESGQGIGRFGADRRSSPPLHWAAARPCAAARQRRRPPAPKAGACASSRAGRRGRTRGSGRGPTRRRCPGGRWFRPIRPAAARACAKSVPKGSQV